MTIPSLFFPTSQLQFRLLYEILHITKPHGSHLALYLHLGSFVPNRIFLYNNS